MLMSRRVLREVYALTILGFLLGSFLATVYNVKPVAGAGVWWDNNWQYRESITIDHTKVSATLTNFPILVDITDSNLTSYAQSNGNDIAFTDYNGNKLDHQIESHNSSTGHLVAWVKVPSLSSTEDTPLYMYYGNPSAGNQQNKTGVWDSDYLMVQHLSETSGTQYDSTANGKNATPSGSVSEGVAGKINGADSFTGGQTPTQWLTVGSISASNWTISFWANSRSTNQAAIYPAGLGSNTGIGVGGTAPDLSNDFYMFDGSTVLHGGPQVVTGTWYYVTVTKSGTTYTIYVNGASQVSGTLSSVSISNMNIGRRSDGMLGFNGIVDEVRVSDMPRSSTWILTEYNNQNNASSFYAVGATESSGAPNVSNPSPSNQQTGVPITLSQLSFNLSSSQNLMDYYVITTPSIGSGQGTGVSNGTYSVSVSGLIFNTTYTWSVNVTDGTLWTNKTFTFTTEPSGRYIVSYSPQVQITLDRGISQAFQITFNGPMDTTWYLDGVQQQYNPAVSSSSWTYRFNGLGIFNVTSVGAYGGSALVETWSVQVIINFSGGVITDGNLYAGPSQPWENGWVFDQTVWKYNDTYYMLYVGSPIGSRKIGFAWSYDGYNWTKYAGNPILSPVPSTWESGEVFWASSVIPISDDGSSQTYWCYYQGSTTASGVFFLTLSGTNIISLVKYSGNPIINDNYELVVVRYNETTWVGYNGYGGGSNLLLSSDGLHWNYVKRGGVLVSDGKSWDSSLLYQQHTFIMNDTLYMVAVGNNQQLGLAYTRVGNWANLTLSPYNPIIPSGSGYLSYVLGGPSVYNSALDTLDFWFSSVQSLGGSGPSGVGFGRVYRVTGKDTTPMVSNPSPSDGATGVAVSTSSLSFNLTDYDGDLMDYSVTTSPNIGSGSGVSVPNGRYSTSVAGLNYSTTYSWTVSVNDAANTTNATFSFTTAVGPFDPFSSGWQYRKRITINHAQVAGNLANFVVSLDMTDPDLASKALFNGYDILFMNGTGVALKLDHEIESYDSATGHLVAWVNVPSLSLTSDTVIYMYYGNGACSNQQNSAGVWDSSFLMVLHFDEASGTQYDSTSYHNNGTPYGVTQGVSGKIDGADSFGTGTPYLDVPNAPSLSPTVVSVEAWIKPNTVSGSHPVIEKYDYLVGRGGYIIRQSDDSLFFDVLSGTTDEWVWAYHVLQVGNWYYVVGTFDGSYLKIYVNGQLVNQAAWTGSNLPSSSSLKIGTRSDGPSSGMFFNGLIDEARVCSVPRSAAWITTEYNDELNSPAFYTVGNEEPHVCALSISVIGQGSVLLNNTGPYQNGDVVQLTAVPTIGWSFQTWSGDLTGSANPATIVITGNMAVTATFTQISYTSTISTVGSGIVNLNNSGPYHYGDTVQLTAAPAVGWSFDHWSGDLTGSTNPATLTITGNVAVTAHFVLPQLYVNPSSIQKGPGDTYTTFQTSVMVNKISDLRGFDINLTWDNDLIALTNVDFNTTLDNIWGHGNWFLAYNVTGAAYYELAAVSTSTSFTSTTATPLATLTFIVKAAVGQTSIHFALVKLSDSQAQSIQAEVTDGSYTVSGPQYLPVLQMTPSSVTCRKYGEYFTVQVNVTNAITMDGFSFTIYYSPTMMSYESVSWGELGSGTITNIDPVNGILEGHVAGTAISGNRWLLNITFQDLATMIWKQGQVNEMDGQISFHYAQLSFSGVQQLVYQEGGLGQISVNNVAFKFMPIQGDITGDGIVDITDLRTVAAYFDVKQGDPLWSAASAYDLNGNGVIDIYDLVLIGANFS